MAKSDVAFVKPGRYTMAVLNNGAHQILCDDFELSDGDSLRLVCGEFNVEVARAAPLASAILVDAKIPTT